MLGKSLAERLTPIRTRYADLAQHPDRVIDALEAGGKRCREIAAGTMAAARISQYGRR